MSGSGATCSHLAPAHPHAPVPLWHSSRLHDNDGDGEAEDRHIPGVCLRVGQETLAQAACYLLSSSKNCGKIDGNYLNLRAA